MTSLWPRKSSIASSSLKVAGLRASTSASDFSASKPHTQVSSNALTCACELAPSGVLNNTL